MHGTRQRPDPLTVWTGLAVGVIGVISGVGAVASGVSPTGNRTADIAWTVTLAVVVSLAGALARPAMLAVAASMTALGAWGWWSLAGAGACVVLLASGRDSSFRRLPTWLSGALSAGLTLQALVRMPERTWSPFGATALAAALILGLIIVSGWWRSPTTVRIASAVGVAGVAVACALLGAPLWQLVDDDVLATDATLAATGTLERLEILEASPEELAAARQRLEDAQQDLASPALTPFRYLPLAAQQLRALDASVGVAIDLLGSAGDGIGLIDAEDLRPGPGNIDVQRLRALKDSLASTLPGLRAAQATMAEVDRGWLLGPTRTATRSLSAAAATALPATELALLGVDAIPAMLGADGPQRWLIQLVEPEEGRSQWQVAVAVDGRLVPTGERGVGPGVGVPATRRIRMADFPDAARAAAERFQAATGEPLDVVLTLDPIGATALTTGTEAAVSLVSSPQDFLDRLNASRLAPPSQWPSLLATPYGDQRILIWSADPTAEAFLGELRRLRTG